MMADLIVHCNSALDHVLSGFFLSILNFQKDVSVR